MDVPLRPDTIEHDRLRRRDDEDQPGDGLGREASARQARARQPDGQRQDTVEAPERSGERPAQRDDDAPEDPAKARRRKRIRAIALTAFAAFLAIAGAGYGWYWYTTARYFESTDDAFTEADNVTISPRVSGYIQQVVVGDNEHVKAGQLLARIDDRDYQAALAQAQADVQAGEAAIGNVDAQLAYQQSVINQQRATLAATEANARFAQQEFERYRDLAKTGYGSVQRLQQAQSQLQSAMADVGKARATVEAAERQLDVLKSQRAQAEAQRARYQAVRDQAQLNLGYTVITAPEDGVVGNRTLRAGQYVQPGTQMLTLVPLHAVYVVANFKETQITHMHPGEAVTISVDAFPEATLKGHVDSLSPGTGAQFALLPPENATGNFTKIVQRTPTKIVIDEDGGLGDSLRAGLSVTPTVDTRGAPTRSASK